jgi:hypothetical protein
MYYIKFPHEKKTVKTKDKLKISPSVFVILVTFTVYIIYIVIKYCFK